MSDDVVGRYGRAYARIWRHQGFRKLTQAEQRLTFYLLTGPQKNRLGLFHFSVSTAAEDLDLGAETLRKGLSNVCTTFDWLFDADARVFYIPSWWRWNRPDNVNVLRGNLKDLSEIPPCALVEAFAANLEYVPVDLRQTFIETLRRRLPERPPTQDLSQYQYQETGARAARGSAGAGAPMSLSVENQRGNDKDEKLRAAAHTVVRDTPNKCEAYQVDAVLSMCSGTKAEAIEALHVARLERRAS